MSDERIEKGMERQLAKRERERAERPPVGWKLGFGTSAAMEKLTISEPLVGYLTEATRIDGGAEVDLAALSNAKLEPELAITLGSDLPPEATDDEVRAAISGVAPAFELVDLDAEEESVEAILADDIFHRAFTIGASGPADVLDGPELLLRAEGGDRRIDAFDVTGGPIGLLRTVSRTLALSGLTLSAGEFVICGSMIPPLDPTAGERFALQLRGAGVAEIAFAG